MGAAIGLAAASTLRFTTAGSVDDGKSTLIGRLLLDAKGLLEDQLAAVERTTRRRGDSGLDLSLFTDGLTVEREQGITIDVAYRYFATPERRFIIADTPGHEQYTRNMVTGASTADAAVILVDATRGIARQTRRHAAVAALLGIPHVIVAVNKMDAVGFDRAVYEAIASDIARLAGSLGLARVATIPISALEGDMVVTRGDLLSHRDDAPWVTRRFAARLAWMDREPLASGQRYLLKHGTQSVRATVEAIDSRLDLETLDPAAAADALAFNDLGRVRFVLSRVIAADPYAENRASGAFILVDEVTHRTVAGGMIEAEGTRG